MAAAGNNYGNNNDVYPHYPSSHMDSSIVSVAATDSADQLSSFSNIGATSVDMGAPGTSILSTTPGNTYSVFNGTSMATPHVAGAAALLWSANPSLSAAEIKARLMATGEPIPALDGVTLSGSRLNVFNALTCDPSQASLAFVSPTDGFRLPLQEQATLAVSASACGVPYNTGSITVETSNGDGTFQLLDNGEGADLQAGDGIYSAYWIPVGYSQNFTLTAIGSGVANTAIAGETYTAISYSLDPDATFNWLESANSERLSISDADDNTETVSIGFDFTFYNDTYNELKVSSNGLIIFGTSTSSNVTNNPIGSSPYVDGFIAPFWDDLCPNCVDNPDATISVWRKGNAPNRRLIVTWEAVSHFSDRGGNISFQVILFENGRIKMQYLDTAFSVNSSYSNGGSATIGIEDIDGVTGVQYSYNQVVPSTTEIGPLILDNQAIIFEPVTPAQGLSIPLNSIDPTHRGYLWDGEEYPEGAIDFVFNANGLDRLLHITGYDIDRDDEVCILLNANPQPYACLAVGPNNDLAEPEVFVIANDDLAEGLNRITVVSSQPTWKWGIQDIGLFDVLDMRLNELDGIHRGFSWDGIEYPYGFVTFKFENATDQNRWLHITGYDVDKSDELCIYLNGSDSPLECLATGQNNSLNSGDIIKLSPEHMVNGANYLTIASNRPTWKWGVTDIGMFDYAPSNHPLGLYETDANEYGFKWGDNNHRTKVVYALGPLDSNTGTHFLGIRGYDIDNSSEACLLLNGASIGCFQAGPNNALTELWYFQLPSSMLNDGFNKLEIIQASPGWKWGVTDATLVRASLSSGIKSNSVIPPSRNQLPAGFIIN